MELLLNIAKKMGMVIQLIPKAENSNYSEEELDEAIMKLSKKVNKAIHKKFVKSFLNDNDNGQ